MTYPLKFRQQVLQVQQDQGLTYAQTAQRFGIGVNTLVCWHRRLLPITQRQVNPYKIASQALLEDVQQYPDAYYHERGLRLGVSAAAIFYAFKRLGISRKKRPLSTPKPVSRHKSTSKTKLLTGKLCKDPSST
ncbi:MAG: IS630 transposase-related protein [Alphaproteobacteria bacterium]|jgi:transposase